MNEHLEGLAGRFKAQKMADQQEMTGGGHRNKFGQAFDQAENDGDELRHALAAQVAGEEAEVKARETSRVERETARAAR